MDVEGTWKLDGVESLWAVDCGALLLQVSRSGPGQGIVLAPGQTQGEVRGERVGCPPPRFPNSHAGKEGLISMVEHAAVEDPGSVDEDGCWGVVRGWVLSRCGG